MSNIERRMSASAQNIKQITIEGYYTSITFEFQSMDRLGKGVVRSLAARSRRYPENEMLAPFRAYRRIILYRDLRPQSPSSYLAFRTTSEGDIEAWMLA